MISNTHHIKSAFVVFIVFESFKDVSVCSPNIALAFVSKLVRDRQTQCSQRNIGRENFVFIPLRFLISEYAKARRFSDNAIIKSLRMRIPVILTAAMQTINRET